MIESKRRIIYELNHQNRGIKLKRRKNNYDRKRYISKIHGVKIRDEGLTQRFEESQKKTSKFHNLKAWLDSDGPARPTTAGTFVTNPHLYVHQLDYDGVTYDLTDDSSRKSFIEIIQKDYPDAFNDFGYGFLDFTDRDASSIDVTDFDISRNGNSRAGLLGRLADIDIDVNAGTVSAEIGDVRGTILVYYTMTPKAYAVYIVGGDSGNRIRNAAYCVAYTFDN